jgi:hypothetical protein
MRNWRRRCGSRSSNLGAVERSDDTALDAFVERQTGKQRLLFLTAAESNSVTEALKAMCAREGFEVKGDPKEGSGAAALRDLEKDGSDPRSTVPGDTHLSNGHPWALDAYVSRKYGITSGAVCHLTVEQLDDCAREFGRRIGNALRLQKAKAA